MNEKPWFKHYDEGVPYTLMPYPERTLVDVISDSASQRPKHPALLFQGEAISYSELDSLSTALASALIELGVMKGDRVALMLPNTPQIILSFFGIWKAGGIVVPLNPLYTERELEYALLESEAETVVVLTPFYEKVKAIQPHTKLRNVIATNIKEYLPVLKRILFTFLKEKKDGHRVTLRPGDVWLGDLLYKYTSTPPSDFKTQPGDPAVLLFSGGTTGTPKAALGTQQSLLISGIQIRTWFKNLLVDWDDIILMNMPLFHAYGLAGVLATGLVGHNTFALIPNPRDLDDMLATIQKVRPAFLPGVPTLFNALLNHPKVTSGQIDLTSLKLCISGASSLLAETKQRFERITGGRIVEAYAMTESMLGATVSPVHGAYKPGSIGIPLPDVEIRIVDIENNQEVLQPEQVGEILLRAPQIMQGYWNKPEETARILRDGWLYTGDIGYQDEDGYAFIVDRMKDLIKPGGFQVWPREVEEVIAAHPMVAEVCVAGVPDAHYVEAVKAWVVLHSGQQISSAELRAYCRENLASYKVPKFVEYCESLPKSSVGKILKRELIKSNKG
ncbi:MAG TPA: long-chain fatty acid--CoA ligase [Anaerolineales bacterium]|nr:long-chain fatty acid--CoA ligase [Anaerolineales bacterium]